MKTIERGTDKGLYVLTVEFHGPLANRSTQGRGRARRPGGGYRIHNVFGLPDGGVRSLGYYDIEVGQEVRVEGRPETGVREMWIRAIKSDENFLVLRTNVVDTEGVAKKTIDRIPIRE